MKISNQVNSHPELLTVSFDDHHAPPAQLISDLETSRYFAPGWFVSGGSAHTQLIDEIVYMPIYVAETIAYDRISIRVTTAGAGGTVARLGIYEATLDAFNRLTPGALRLDAGTVSVASTGTKDITTSGSLTPGYYFLTISSDGSPILTGVSSSFAGVASLSSSHSDVMNAGSVILSVGVADGAVAFIDPAVTPDNFRNSNSAVVMLRR